MKVKPHIALALLLAACGACTRSPAPPDAGRPRTTSPTVVPKRALHESARTIGDGIPARVAYLPPLAGPEAGAGGGAAQGGNADEAALRRLDAAVWDEFDRLGRVFDAASPTSEIGGLNRTNKTGIQRVSPDLAAVLATSFIVHEASDGAFDPTSSPLTRVWDEAVRREQEPDSAEIAKALERVGLRHVHRAGADGREVTFDRPDIALDFGAVARGYAVDRVVALLKTAGVTAGLVRLGGEIAAFGRSPDGPWRIGVAHPRLPDAVYGAFEVRGDVRVSTSGSHKPPLRLGPRLFHPLFDPATGQPVATRVAGVTTAAFGAGADNATLVAAATAIAVLGPDRGRALAAELGIETLILADRSGRIREVVTPGIAARFVRQAQ